MLDRRARPARRWIAGLAILCGVAAAAQSGDGVRLIDAFSSVPQAGPDAARGAVVWLHGKHWKIQASETESPYYLHTLREGGWDVFRLDRHNSADRTSATAKALIAESEALLAQGYDKIVFAGQSCGAWISLKAATQWSRMHAVVGTAPACHGDDKGSRYNLQNATGLYSMLQRINPTRVMLFFFRGDNYEPRPGKRWRKARDILEQRGFVYDVIGEPETPVGHRAASGVEFDADYGRRILEFING